METANEDPIAAYLGTETNDIVVEDTGDTIVATVTDRDSIDIPVALSSDESLYFTGWDVSSGSYDADSETLTFEDGVDAYVLSAVYSSVVDDDQTLVENRTEFDEQTKRQAIQERLKSSGISTYVLRPSDSYNQLDWKYSKRYYRLRARLRDLNRRLADIRKMEHNILANELLEHGNEFIVEDMNYKALQKRSKETKVNAKTGRIHTKKRFGKSLSRCAPAMFITILTNKVTRYGGKVIKVSTFETKASQFDHTDESYTKKKLSERMAHLSSGEVVQRDLYSAFLLEHIDTESLEYNTEALKSAFPAFLKMHENTKKHLQKEENNLPASVGF